MRQIAQRDDIRDLILDGVEVLLARYGYKKMTMEDLAQQVGIGKGTIYLHFPSKEEVTLSHIDRIGERVLDEMARISASKQSSDTRIREMLIARVLIRFDAIREYSENLDGLLSALRKPLLARREVQFRKEADLLKQVIVDGRKTGSFRDGNAEVASQSFILCTNSLLPYSLAPSELGKRKELEARVTSIANLLLHGLTRQKGHQLRRVQ